MKASKCLLFLLPLSIFSACSFKTETKDTYESEEIKVSHNYAEIKNYELMWDTMFDVDSNDYYVYFYSTSCNHCEELKDYMIEKALLTKNIFFVKGSNKDQIGNDPKKSKYAENPGDIWILGYPSLLKITDHKCLKNLAGITQIKGELK